MRYKNKVMWFKTGIIIIMICSLIVMVVALYNRIQDYNSVHSHQELQLQDDNNKIEVQLDVQEVTPTPTTEPTPTPISYEPYVIAWISDTQGYTMAKPQIFTTMTQWIADNAEEENIEYVIHTGDIVDDKDDSEQWDNALDAMYILDGHVPVLTVAGNHDINSGKHEYEEYLKYFGEDKYSDIETVGGWYKDGRGRYDLIEINGEPVILMSIGYSVVSSDLEWVNEVLAEYRDHTAILCVHGYIDTDESYSSDGKRLLPEVVAVNDNIKMVICGHRHGVHHNSVSFDDDGDGIDDRTVYQLLFNGQTTKNYGGGYMCFLTFDSESNQMNVSYYSPYYDSFENENLEEFSIPWE